MSGIVLPVAQIIPCTEAEGPGRRFALWFQGCPLRCPGCCNPEMLPFTGGQRFTLAGVVEQVKAAAAEQGVEGVTLLGGEPLAHATAALALAREVHLLGLTVMVFSGYTLEEARTLPDPAVADLLAETDILVDGPYVRELPETRRRWIGSSNQRIHFLTERYRADDPRWDQPNTLEIRLIGNELTVNGFPARSAVGLWKRPRLKDEGGRMKDESTPSLLHPSSFRLHPS
ncbi:MAG TPA: 4Fe-4S single cluster domain-containing protein, partial [Gemmataceae bacterium]|nr:4Fe-4S single cluster domain-containing protein [Gemmataceae bacterium]